MDGPTLGPYRLIDPLGAGGMGEVYRAHDSRLQRDVAVKLLPSARAGDDDARAQLLGEARAAAALNHPHICTIYEVGDADGEAYIAMELVDGRSLDQLVPAGGLDPGDVLTYGVQIADAVAHAHDKGILHRDLKTANIMVTADGRVKVLDFGIAKRMAHAASSDVITEASTLATEPGRVTGTLAYLSPEQLRGLPARAASDVWAIGVVLYEMAAGRRPFEGTTGFEIASAILHQSPRALPNTVPTVLNGIITRCLAKEPSHRYQRTGELRAALEAVRAGHQPSTPPPLGTAEMAPPLLSRGLRPAVALTTVAALVAFTALAVLVWRTLPGPTTRTVPAGRIDSVAVLPLENLSRNAEEEYYAAGIQDGLITELARLRTLNRVIERRSTRRFAGSTQRIAEIAAALGVDVVVTGSVLRAGQRVQVNAQVIDGASERHLWADRFERDERDVLAIQSDVARAIATAIGAEPAPEDRRRWSMTRPVDPVTYESYLRGMHLITPGPATRQDRIRGVAILQEAVDRDPGNAHAYAGLALGYVTLGHGPNGEADVWPKARAAAIRAVTLDPNLAEAHSALAEVRMYYERDWAGAGESFRRANELNPNLAMNHYHYAWYHALFERWTDAITEHKRAQELDPLTPQHTALLGALYLYVGQHEAAIAEARKAIEFAPNAPAAWGVLATGLSAQGRHVEAEDALRKGVAINPAMLEYELGMLYAAHGKREEARAILGKLEAQPATPFSGWSLSQLHIALGDFDSAFKWLNLRPAHAFLPWARVHPPYAPIRSDPRFAALMAEMKLPAVR